MGKVYLRKVKSDEDRCSECFFNPETFNENLKTNYKCYKMPCWENNHYKKISEKHAKKLLKSGKCKIVQQ